jgi:two-component system cell cycle sensor histidine kinase/response regulator CckA
MTRSLRTLLVEDNELDCELLIRELRRGGYALTYERVETEATLLHALAEHSWDLVLSDFTMPTFSAFAALEVVRRRHPDLPFIIVSGTIGEEAAVEGMRGGAQDFITKANLSRLLPAIARELAEVATRQMNRKLEAQLRQSQKMEAIGRLASGVAHDFNNLLSVIVGYTDLIVDRVPAGDALLEDLEEVRAAAMRAASLTRQLLALSRQQVLAPKVLSLDEIVTTMQKMLRRLLPADVTLVSRSARPIGNVYADRGQIEQVIMNLAVNAGDAMPTGGTLTIETANVELDAEYAASNLDAAPGTHVMLAFTDTGEGMDAATQARIFEPFFTTKELNKGTGLGLSTVFGIVRQSGGHVTVSSQAGSGSMFSVYLPCALGAADAIAGSTPPPQTLEGFETILLVEDEEKVRGVFRAILIRSGYTVLAAEDGLEALHIAEQHEGAIDLLLTDLKMPTMNGIELAERLYAVRPAARVLYTSGYPECSTGKRAGIDFLPKPVTSDALLRKVRTMLDGRTLAVR